MGCASCAVAGVFVMSIWTFLLKLVVGRPRGYVEIFNQASNPTTILAEMIAADLLKLGWKETLEPQTKQELAIHHPMPYRYTIETKNYVIKKTVYSSSHLTPSFDVTARSEEHTSELQSLMRISYAGFCLKTKKTNRQEQATT